LNAIKPDFIVPLHCSGEAFCDIIIKAEGLRPSR
jgi:hypothetical protein